MHSLAPQIFYTLPTTQDTEMLTTAVVKEGKVC